MRRASIIVFSALALLLTAGGAWGEEEEATLPPEQPRRRSAEILAHTEQPEAEASWLSHHLERVHLHSKAGLAYTRPLRLAERDFEFSLRGPALGRKRVGLSFEITF
jgi:hypothetical protein